MSSEPDQTPTDVPGRRRRSSAEVRAAILRAARELSPSDSGALPGAAPSLTAIAERAEVSRSVLHRHFPTLEALLAALDVGAEAADDPAGATVAERARGQILKAAREVFAAEGYANATTRRVAERAGVQEITVFRAFGTKAELFRAAVFEPFGSFVTDYAEHWLGQAASPHSVDDVVRGYLEGLYRLLREHSASTFALLAARAHEQPGVSQVEGQRAALHGVIGALEKLAYSEAARSGYESFDIPVATRISVAMVLATALFKDWLFDDPQPVSDDTIVEELIQIWLHGTKRSGRECSCDCHQPRAAAWSGEDALPDRSRRYLDQDS